jgi:hypothetical protein
MVTPDPLHSSSCRSGCEDLCEFQHANAAVGTGATLWPSASRLTAAAAGRAGADPACGSPSSCREHPDNSLAQQTAFERSSSPRCARFHWAYGGVVAWPAHSMRRIFSCRRSTNAVLRCVADLLGFT